LTTCGSAGPARLGYDVRVTEVYLLRHAHAGNPAAWHGPDEKRPLSEKGRRQAERLGGFLASVGFDPDAIISSPKLRASQTADIVAGHLGRRVALDDRLGGSLSIETVDALLAEAGDPERPVLVGHDPDFSTLAALLSGADELTVAKGALVRIDMDRPLAPGAGQLRWLVPPDLLRGLDA